MFGKNRNKKVGICVMVVTASLVLAALWAVLATPETALADPPDNPPGQDKDKPGGGGDACCSLDFCITFRDDVEGDGDAILSDGEGEYCNGGKIMAGAGGTAKHGCGFRFDMNRGQKFGQGRRGFLDLSACEVEVGVDLSELVELQFRFNKLNEADIYPKEVDGDPKGAGGLNFCSMEVGDTATVPMFINVGDASGNSVSYLIVFGAPFPPTGCPEVGCNSDPVTVTRKPDLPDGRRVWTIESFATTNNDGAAVRNTDNEEVLCNLPFQMTLTEQP